MLTDDPRSATLRLRQKVKGDLAIRRIVDCGSYFLFENAARNAPASYKVIKRNGAVRKSRKKNPAKPLTMKQQVAKAAAGGILKSALKRMER